MPTFRPCPSVAPGIVSAVALIAVRGPTVRSIASGRNTGKYARVSSARTVELQDRMS